MCNNDNSCREIAEILAIINVLQQNACTSETCLDTCDRGFLGCGTNSLTCNTRPVQLYLCNGQPLSMPIQKDSTDCTEGCSTVFRVLSQNTDGTYSATNSFCTVNLHCVCTLRCLSDTYVECI